MALKLSIIICTFNRAASLRRTLRSMARQDAPPAEWEVLVIDNNCTDNTKEVFDEFYKDFAEAIGEENSTLQPPDSSLIAEPQQGLSHARNRGIAEARGEILAIIDDDVELSTGFVSAWIDFFVHYPDVGAAGGRIEPMWEETPPCWMSSWTARPIAGVVDFGSTPRRFPAGKYPIGANMAFRRDVLLRDWRLVAGGANRMHRASNEVQCTPPPHAMDDIHHTHCQPCPPPPPACSSANTLEVFNPALGRIGKKLLAGEEKDLFARLKASGVEIYYCPESSLHHIIPRERLTIGYLSRVSRMFGVSERVRAGLWRALLAEVVKWGGTAVLSLFYLLTLHPARAWGILVLRWSVTVGIIGSAKLI